MQAPEPQGEFRRRPTIVKRAERHPLPSDASLEVALLIPRHGSAGI